MGAALTGWQLAEVAAVSQDGTWMVGFGSNPAFDEEAFLVHLPGGATCYANCDGSSTLPLLNVLDFVCFQTRFAAGDAYANCDGSTMSPPLNVNDFVCFQTRFVQGCP